MPALDKKWTFSAENGRGKIISWRIGDMAKKRSTGNYFNDLAAYQTEAEPRATTPEGVPVFCAFDELVPIGKVVPNPGNPNTHPPRQIELLAAIIQGQGWRKPVTISKRSGFVTCGHGRLLAAQYMQASVVPVEYQEYATEAEEYADLMADNRLAELSKMDANAGRYASGDGHRGDAAGNERIHAG